MVIVKLNKCLSLFICPYLLSCRWICSVRIPSMSIISRDWSGISIMSWNTEKRLILSRRRRLNWWISTFQNRDQPNRSSILWKVVLGRSDRLKGRKLQAQSWCLMNVWCIRLFYRNKYVKIGLLSQITRRAKYRPLRILCFKTRRRNTKADCGQLALWNCGIAASF